MAPELQTPEQTSSELRNLWNSGQLDEAEVLIKQGLARFPDDPQLLSDAGVIADKLGKKDEAVKYLEQAHELAPEIPLYLQNYLILLSANDDTEKIVGKKPEILHLFGDDTNILKTLAAACLETGADDHFFEVLRRLHELAPNERHYLDDMAAFAQEKKRVADRLFALEALATLVPDDLQNLVACFHMTHWTRQYHKRDQYGARIRAIADAAEGVNVAFIDMLLRVTERFPVLPLLKHRQRLMRLFDFYRSTIHLDGEIAECGVFRGVSTFMICQFWLTHELDFDGTGYHVFDSFQGLSEIEEEDIEGAEDAEKLNMMFTGNFACSEEDFRRSVEEFPSMAIYPGWIPSRFDEVADRRFRFVHVDVDLARPSYDSFAFFYPRLVPGGVIVCDDGSWPGTRRAIERFASEVGVEPKVTETDQIALTKG